MEQKAELLAPAGSIETMYAAFAAGADAVYIGGSRFGARAYADNAQNEQLLEAIDYAHMHGKKLYLTVNTLLKEQELNELYEYLLPFYGQGLDAVIVQDFGVLRQIREYFPDLPIHASTQMTMSGMLSAQKLEELGVSRVVTPRELSLKEISQIHKECSLEIESFVHGALCYCYSGQCLFSSIAGGRSGNRGRCAQPCRMPYTVEKNNKVVLSQQKGYILSPKDLCTIEILPQLIEAGIYSLKIEGRMKKPEYTAGVVSIYRKYLDKYLENPTKPYRVSEEDKAHLMDLFNRKGFTDGYYTKHNAASMITYTAPDFRTSQEKYLDEIRDRYIGRKLKEKIKGTVKIYHGKPAILSLSLSSDENIKITVSSGMVQEAKSRPLTCENIKKQIEKLGDTDFVWENLEAETDEASFCPVGVLNELRRNAIDALKASMLDKWHRKEEKKEATNIKENSYEHETVLCEKQQNKSEVNSIWNVSVQTQKQLEVAASHKWINQITIDCHICEPNEYAALTKKVHESGKNCFLAMPKMFRQENETWYIDKVDDIKAAEFDGIIASTPESWLFAKKYFPDKKLASDHSLYAWNTKAAKELAEWGNDYRTLPAELNKKELLEIADKNSELIVYGRIAMMVSAQCICKNVLGCVKKSQEMTLVDRMRNRFPVQNICRECYNIIYNSLPISLDEQWSVIKKMTLRGYRIDFTTEKPQQVSLVLEVYKDIAQAKQPCKKLENTTRGHFKRGAE